MPQRDLPCRPAQPVLRARELRRHARRKPTKPDAPDQPGRRQPGRPFLRDAAVRWWWAWGCLLDDVWNEHPSYAPARLELKNPKDALSESPTQKSRPRLRDSGFSVAVSGTPPNL